jgi:hypothetical protein
MNEGNTQSDSSSYKLSFIVFYFVLAWAHDGSRHPTTEDISMHPKVVAEIGIQTIHAITVTEESIGPID